MLCQQIVPHPEQVGVNIIRHNVGKVGIFDDCSPPLTLLAVDLLQPGHCRLAQHLKSIRAYFFLRGSFSCTRTHQAGGHHRSHFLRLRLVVCSFVIGCECKVNISDTMKLGAERANFQSLRGTEVVTLGRKGDVVRSGKERDLGFACEIDSDKAK